MRAHQASSAGVRLAEAGSAEALVRVLVVEDEWIIASDLADCLKSLGYHVTGIASTSADAVGMARDQRPDIVLMDIVLRGNGDGIDAAGRVREDLGIPVVYLTAYADDVVLERARATRPYGYLVKPYEERQLRITIEMALNLHRTELALSRSEARFRALVESAAEAFFVHDATGRIMDVNAVACASLGYGRADLMGMDFSLIDPAYVRALPGLVERAVRGPVTLESTHLRRDGTRFPVETRLAPFETHAGPGQGPLYLALVRDISERTTLVHELEGALNRAKTLKSAIPFCAMRKPITSEHDLEAHIKAHHDAILKHGICQECLDAIKLK